MIDGYPRLSRPRDQDIVVVGCSGDLASHRLLPALYNLEREGLLPEHGNLIGYSLAEWGDADFRVHTLKSIATNSRHTLEDGVWERFSSRLRHLCGDGHDMRPMEALLTQDQRVLYLATPPSAVLPIVTGLGQAGLAEGTNLVLEKPFGRDVGSARTLNESLHRVLPEERIFRIDHYLGKETVQNLLVFRFANPLFERSWNSDAIHRIEITVAEPIGVGRRGRFYEETGAIQDIVQNHLFQLLALVAMEPPLNMAAASIQAEKSKLLRSVRVIEPAEVVRGQYTHGVVDGVEVPGYREEAGVAADSQTETYAAMRLQIDSWRWGGTRFLLRTGKRLNKRETRIVVVFRDAPHNFFVTTEVERLVSQKVNIRIQPDEGMSLTFVAKQPGPVVRTQPVLMNFDYGQSFKTSPPEAYERLLLDAMVGDHTLFISESEIERAWEILQEVLENPPPVMHYAAGSLGPREAERLVDPRRWHALED
ncbi:MAG TPA: glucose-6-phosphate dehydrogenase [Candidatus Dormibacteraeota bacterium]|jgi:glucose-6-phosphate 1-dehydrogenase|nr:glucose-6-phosphate dehydrogenase [Candidatus Dormibacteraeota bacterium]